MALPAPYMSPEEYLEFERKSEFKHKLINGQIYAISGVSRWHSFIVGNISGELRNRLRSGPCSAHASDLRVRIPDTTAYLYPDVVVYCGEGQWQDDAFDTLENPVVIFEVDDRGAKFSHYRRIESLQTYVLVSQETVSVEVFERVGDGWLSHSLNAMEDQLMLKALELSVPVSEIYDRVPARVGPPSKTVD